MAIIGANVRVEVQASLGSDRTITAISKANPAVVTSAGHGYSNGDVVVLDIPGGMVELDGQAARVANKATDSFQLEGIDSTNFSTFTSGSCAEVTFSTLSSAQNITMPNPAPAKIDVTTLIDKSKQYEYGLPDAPDGSITGLFNPGGTAEGYVKAATEGNESMAFRVTFAGSQVTIFNANVSGGTGFELSGNAAATATISFTPIRQVCHFVS